MLRKRNTYKKPFGMALFFIFTLGLVVFLNAPRAAADAAYSWQDATHIVVSEIENTGTTPTAVSFTFTGSVDSGSGKGTFKDKPDGCSNTAEFAVAWNSDKKVYQASPVHTSTSQDCGISLRSADINNTSSGPAPPDPTTTPAEHDSNATCDIGGNPLNWIICPVYNGVADFSDWVFSNLVQPFLHTAPISTSPSDPSYKIWSEFRIIGNLFLVIALIVIVFGESIGGGLIETYTAKKALPRVLVAAILINLSIYIVAFAVDVTNIIGGGIGELMTAPLAGAGAFNIHPSGIQAGEVLGSIGVVGALAAIGGLIAIPPISFILLFLVMPVVMGLLAAFITMILRKAIILALVLVSPVAFALYCLPNTEQYFRKWWDLLVKTLAVYPIVIVFFAIADIMSVTVMNANGKDNGLALVISFLLQFLPLLFIPYAFRMAGGAIGQVHEMLTNYHKRAQEGIKGNAANPLSLRNQAKRNYGAKVTRNMAQGYRSYGRRLPGFRTFMGSAIEREALLNQQAKQRIFTIKDNGDDSIVNARASFIDSDGVRRTLDGKEVKHGDWVAAKRLYPNISDFQAVADYRSTKVLDAQQASDFTRNFGLAAQQEGLSLDETRGIFTGLAFARQNERGEFKHGDFVRGANGQYVFKPVGSGGNVEKENAFLDEQYYKRGSFEGSRMFSSYFDSMSDLKKKHLDTVTSLTNKQQGGAALSKEEKESLSNSRGRLKQIREIEKAFDIGVETRPGEEGAEPVARSGAYGMREGLQGASAASQAAFKRLKEVGEGGNLMTEIDKEIARGDTYEKHYAGDRPVQNTGNSNSSVNRYG